MSTIIVPQTNLTQDGICKVLRDGLGDRYNVLPGMAKGQLAISLPHEDADAILVGKGSNRLIKADIRMTRRGGETIVRISPGGLSLDLLVNSFGVARKVRDVLANSPDLRLR